MSSSQLCRQQPFMGYGLHRQDVGKPLHAPAPHRHSVSLVSLNRPSQRQHKTEIVTQVYQAERQETLVSNLADQGGLNLSNNSSSADGETQEGTLPNMWQSLANSYGAQVALHDPHRTPAVTLTFRELHTAMEHFASGLRSLGLQKGEKVSLFSENSSRWIVADQAIMMNGAADAVRGSTAPLDELAFILHHSNSTGLVVQDSETLQKMLPELTKPGAEPLKFVIILWTTNAEQQGVAAAQLPYPVLSYDEVMLRGRQLMALQPFTIASTSKEDLATLVYTSGTTGHPKGVKLTHGNLMYQVNNLNYFLPVQPGESVLSLLPPWHIYERSCSYYILSRGVKQVYSNVRKFKDDLTQFPPDHFVCVPLVLDTLHHRVMLRFKTMSSLRQKVIGMFLSISTAYVRASRVVDGVAIQYAHKPPTFLAALFAAITATLLRPLHQLASKLVYSKVREALGIKKTVVSGGGSLASHLDEFYEIIGLDVLNGWGLTETSPVLACRRSTIGQNIRGSVGVPTPGTELRVVDPETLQDMPAGVQGLVLAKGPGVMQGYYGDEIASAKAFRAGDGWFDTGDLGWRAPAGIAGSQMAGHLVLTGRAKDTIVLSSGENVEPQPIEDACQSSPYIKHMLLVGQDKRELGALVFPDEDVLAGLAAEGRPVDGQALKQLLKDEVNRLNSGRLDYQPFQHISQIAVIRQPLSFEAGTLTRTMKPKRPEIMKQHHAETSAVLQLLRRPLHSDHMTSGQQTHSVAMI